MELVEEGFVLSVHPTPSLMREKGETDFRYRTFSSPSSLLTESGKVGFITFP